MANTNREVVVIDKVLPRVSIFGHSERRKNLRSHRRKPEREKSDRSKDNAKERKKTDVLLAGYKKGDVGCP